MPLMVIQCFMTNSNPILSRWAVGEALRTPLTALRMIHFTAEGDVTGARCGLAFSAGLSVELEPGHSLARVDTGGGGGGGGGSTTGGLTYAVKLSYPRLQDDNNSSNLSSASPVH